MTAETAIAPSGGAGAAHSVSVVVPVFNEVESLAELTERICDVGKDGIDLVEILFVDDGSTDGSWAEMRRLAAENPLVHAVRLRRNFGKAAALDVGVHQARGSIVVTMDADLQDDPVELPRFVEMIDQGYDLVSGWKKTRNDPLSKTLPSLLFNAVTARVSGTRLHDFNCGYKAYRREVFDSIQLYGELHRYIPVLASALGFRIGEIAVRHHARKHGQSKYGVSRFLRGFLDLLTVVTITRYARRPAHLFGGVGAFVLLIGGSVLTYLTGLKLFTGADIGDRPLLLFGVMAVIVGIQLMLFGMLSELINSRSPALIRSEDLVSERAEQAAAPVAKKPRPRRKPAKRAAAGSQKTGTSKTEPPPAEPVQTDESVRPGA